MQALLSTYPYQLEWLRFLKQSLPLQFFFSFWDYFDTFPFAMLMVIALWACNKHNQCLRLAFILSFSFIVNTYLKGIFELPRPYQLDPAITFLRHSSFGFPSGAAQTAGLLLGLAFIESKKTYIRLGISLYACLLAFSRLSLGAHFFTDVAAGLLIGLLLLPLYIYIKKLMETKNSHKSLGVSLFILLAIGQHQFFGLFCLFAGLALGLHLYGEEIKQKAYKPLSIYGKTFTLCSFFALFFLQQRLLSPLSVKYILQFFMGFWLSYLGPTTGKLLQVEK